jgi:excisionase family DNA binding protein
LTTAEIERAFACGIGAKYPPILTTAQAAEVLQIPLKTVYEWHHKGFLRGCVRKRGKHLRFWRDKLIQLFFSEKEWNNENNNQKSKET